MKMPRGTSTFVLVTLAVGAGGGGVWMLSRTGSPAAAQASVTPLVERSGPALVEPATTAAWAASTGRPLGQQLPASHYAQAFATALADSPAAQQLDARRRELLYEALGDLFHAITQPTADAYISLMERWGGTIEEPMSEPWLRERWETQDRVNGPFRSLDIDGASLVMRGVDPATGRRGPLVLMTRGEMFLRQESTFTLSPDAAPSDARAIAGDEFVLALRSTDRRDAETVLMLTVVWSERFGRWWFPRIAAYGDGASGVLHLPL